MKKMSIKSYALSFIILYIIAFSISSIIAFLEIQALNRNLIEENLKSGKTELVDSIKKLVINHQKITDKFSTWDEVHQQLEFPQYYSYWQTHRLLNSGMLTEYITEASIYDLNGLVLEKLSTITLPEKIIISDTKPYFNITNNTAQLITTAPILKKERTKETEKTNIILGYVTTKSILLSQLLKSKQFNHVDINTIKSHFLEDKHIEVDQLINYFSYDVKENTTALHVAGKVKQILLRNSLILITFALLFYFLISYFLSRPLRQISIYLDALDEQSDLQTSPQLEAQFHIHELETVKSSLSRYQKKLRLVHANLDEKNQELWKMAHHDALTGALNRRAFEEHWTNIARQFSQSRCQISLILFDINQFKSINDSYGHPVGDVVLKKIAFAIQKVLRQGEKLYRIGGDEFAAILYNCQPEDAVCIASRCQVAISEIPFSREGIKEPVRASIGVAHNDITNKSSISNLLWQADIAVYSAKKPGQSHIVTYSEKIKNISNTVLSSRINNIVFDAIETGNNIVMYYQPIINLVEDATEYYEALLRINDNDEIIPPGKIFQLIEAKKLDCELDGIIFKQIANDLKHGIIPVNTGVSVNVSGPSIINPEIIDQLSIFIPYLSEYKIVFEITETSLITNIDHATENIRKLKSLGFVIALDDFGSGYSSISYLSTMPVDIVKFDITLIRQLEDDKQFSIIRHLVNMIGETGHLLVAEGIETEDIKDKIKHLGFNYAQGYLYGKPSPTIK